MTALAVFLVFLFVATIGHTIMAPGVHQLTRPVDHAEAPTWDGRKSLLYFVDINAGKIFSYSYETGNVYSISINGTVTPVVPSKSNPDLLVVGVDRSVVVVEWDGTSTVGGHQLLATVSKQFPKSRFNDGKADSRGRLWFGTMGAEGRRGVRPNEGALYRIDRDNLAAPAAIIAPVNISNGLGWSRANDKFYYIDTPTRKVIEYKYDEHKGEIRRPRVAMDLARFGEVTGVPDGMTLDEEDKLWIALWGGGAVIRVDPDNGALLQVVAIPATFVTSVMWGGPHLDILFVTTSRRDLGKQMRKRQSAAGSVFAVTGLGVKGMPAFSADILDAI